VSVKSDYLGLLEQLLTHLKNAKLAYLRAADVANQTQDKRYFNQQALLRNRFFQITLGQLQNENMSLDDLVIRNFNFDQLLISSIDNRKATALEKCMEADSHLTVLLEKILALPLDGTPFEEQLQKIEGALANCNALLPSFQVVKTN